MLEVLKLMLLPYKQERELSGACRRAIQAARFLTDLHQLRMNVETSDQIMVCKRIRYYRQQTELKILNFV